MSAPRSTQPPKAVLACYPVNGAPAGYRNTYFPKKECEKCSALMYVGPNVTAMKKKDPGLPLLCMPCAQRVAVEQDGRAARPTDTHGFVQADAHVWDTPAGLVIDVKKPGG